MTTNTKPMEGLADYLRRKAELARADGFNGTAGDCERWASEVEAAASHKGAPVAWRPAMKLLEDWMIGQSGPLVGVAFDRDDAAKLVAAASVVSRKAETKQPFAESMYAHPQEPPITVAKLARASDRKASVIMKALNVFGANVTLNQPIDLALIGAALSCNWHAAQEPPKASEERERAEQEFTVSAYWHAQQSPVGSRDWMLFWQGWQAAARNGAGNAAQPAKGDEALLREAVAALERIATPGECGCLPVCQCSSPTALRVEIDAMRDDAIATLAKLRERMGE